MKKFISNVLIFAFLFVTVFVSTSLADKYTRASDSLALVSLYNTNGGKQSWVNKKNWLVDQKMIYEWYGVSTTEIPSGTDTLIVVKKLNLAANGLTGTLPNLNLPDLEYLYLNNNLLTGTMPTLINLTKLKELDLSHNGITGTIPAINFPQLIELNLSKNTFRGTIPTFATFVSLKILNLDSNQFTGTLPALTSSLLESVHMASNQITGTIPNFALTFLQDLTLSGNQLSGPIPNFNLKNLLRIQLSNNKLSGAIPSFNLPSLKELSLANNQLSGPIPAFTLPKLEFINLDNNKLTGNVPNFSSTNLQSISIKLNSLTGAVPNYVFPNLKNLNLEGNIITDLPRLSSINANCVVNVRNNKLTFEDLEVNIDFVDFHYENQDTILPIETVTMFKQTKLIAVAAGIHNQYQWFKGTDTIPGATDRVYFAPSDSVYHFKVTNSFAPNLTLTSVDTVITIDTVNSVPYSTENKYNLTNMPNPFTNTTTIRFNLTVGGNTKISVTDALGYEICALYDGYLNEGTQEIRFEPQKYNLPAGVYFYTITAGNYKYANKMIFIK